MIVWTGSLVLVVRNRVGDLVVELNGRLVSSQCNVTHCPSYPGTSSSSQKRDAGFWPTFWQKIRLSEVCAVQWALFNSFCDSENTLPCLLRSFPHAANEAIDAISHHVSQKVLYRLFESRRYLPVRVKEVRVRAPQLL